MPEAFANQRHHPWQGPEGGEMAEGFLGAALQIGGQLEAVQRLETRFATSASGMFECFVSTGFPRGVPTPGRLVAHAQAPGDLGLERPRSKSLTACIRRRSSPAKSRFTPFALPMLHSTRTG